MLTKKTMEEMAKGYFPYLYEEAKPCPHCGKHPVQLRHVVTYANPYAVCCGGDGCCFYQSGATPEDAIKKWNDSTDKTPCDKTMTKDGKSVPDVPSPPIPFRKVIDTITLPHSTCANCKYRKEKFTEIPTECKECAWLPERDRPYTIEIPVYEDTEHKEV